MITGEKLYGAGFEGPVMRPEDDRYGFAAIAEGLARSISALDENVSTVIGIEGKWGTGKTSLLNLVLHLLKSRVPQNTQIIPFSPWLNSPDESPVTSLLLTIAARIEKLDIPAKARTDKISPLAENILAYVQQTSRRLSPLARFVGNFTPGIGIVAEGMDAFAKTDLSRREKTTSERRAVIEQKIAELGVSFIVVIDDLDRLDPTQAIEILRMVRSVADFSCLRYIMCYDRDLLIHTLENSLGVQNGRMYLQKIIPLSFSLPRLESFDLRREFREGALALWREVNEGEPDEDLQQMLANYTEVYGEALSTPREVNQVLNAIRFRYPGLRDYIFYPDLCLIQLLVTVNPALATWVEHYLTEWSIVGNRDGDIQDDERAVLTKNLMQALSHFGAIRAKSVWEIHDWLPGIEGFDDKTLSLFNAVSVNDSEQAMTRRSLVSPVYWRYYFSFSAPQNVMSDVEIRDIISLAGSNYAALERRLLCSVIPNGVSSRTWFEHILTRLTPAVTSSAGPRVQRNLLKFLFNCSDRVIPYYRERDLFFQQEHLGLDALASQLIKQLKKNQPVLAIPYISRLFRDTESFSWAAFYWKHMSELGDGDPVSREELFNLRLMIKVRLAGDDVSQRLAEMPFLASFLYAWRDVAGEDAVRKWFAGDNLDDRTFLQMLLNLRTAVNSSNRGTYLRLDLKAFHDVFGITGLEARLARIKAESLDALRNLVTEVDNAIKLNTA